MGIAWTKMGWLLSSSSITSGVSVMVFISPPHVTECSSSSRVYVIIVDDDRNRLKHEDLGKPKKDNDR